MERILQSQQTPFGFVAVAIQGTSKGTGQLQRPFPGLEYAAALAGEEVIIPRRGKPVVELRPACAPSDLGPAYRRGPVNSQNRIG